MINIRAAAITDMNQVFDWRNMPFIYEKGFSGRPVRRVTHEQWFEAAIANPAIKMFIIEKSKYPIGLIRFDQFQEQKNFIVSIYIQEGFTKNGFGVTAIRRGIDRIRERVPDAEFHAGFLPTNDASKKAFAKAGFIAVTENTMRFR